MLVTQGLKVQTSVWSNFYFKLEVSFVAEREDEERDIVETPKKTMETQTDLAKTAVDLARLDHGADIIEHLNLIQSHGRKSQSNREWS